MKYGTYETTGRAIKAALSASEDLKEIILGDMESNDCAIALGMENRAFEMMEILLSQFRGEDAEDVDLRGSNEPEHRALCVLIESMGLAENYILAEAIEYVLEGLPDDDTEGRNVPLQAEHRDVISNSIEYFYSAKEILSMDSEIGNLRARNKHLEEMLEAIEDDTEPPASEPEGIFRALSEGEMKDFRQWARENYNIGDAIPQGIWHPVTMWECELMNKEAALGPDDDTPKRDWEALASEREGGAPLETDGRNVPLQTEHRDIISNFIEYFYSDESERVIGKNALEDYLREDHTYEKPE